MSPCACTLRIDRQRQRQYRWYRAARCRFRKMVSLVNTVGVSLVFRRWWGKQQQQSVELFSEITFWYFDAPQRFSTKFWLWYRSSFSPSMSLTNILNICCSLCCGLCNGRLWWRREEQLSGKVKLFWFQSVCVLTLTCGHKLWVMTELRKWVFSIGCLGLSLRDRVRGSDSWKELGVEPLLLNVERGQLRRFWHLLGMPPGGLPLEVYQAHPTGKRPQGRPRYSLEGLYITSGLIMHRHPPERVGKRG